MKRTKKSRRNRIAILAAVVIAGVIITFNLSSITDTLQKEAMFPLVSSSHTTTVDAQQLPKYSGSPYVEVNGNQPEFTEEDFERLSVAGYEYYSALDALERCGYVEACVGKEIMPTEERGSIGMIKPSGWHTIKYSCVDGRYLYNRCHLLGYQLTGENANESNLITGTRYLNIDGMLPFENKVADYVEATGNHVAMRVTPIFENNNLVASGVEMEAESLEDEGHGICFNVYCYNVQPGIVIDYATGTSQEK